MKANCWMGKQKVEVVDVPDPQILNKRDAIVRITATAICGSDLHLYNGFVPTMEKGDVLGHEFMGEIVEVGPELKNRKVGDRVVVANSAPCGACRACGRGQENLCDDLEYLNGMYAEYLRVPARFVRVNTWRVPDGLPMDEAAMAEPLACVLRGAERVPPGEVLVLGGGFVGRLFAAVLQRRGDTVYVRDADPARSGPEPSGAVGAVVVCAPGAGADALGSVEPGGTVLVFADAGEVDAAEVYRREVTITGSRSATRPHMEEAVALLPELGLPEPLVLPLDRFDEGLTAYRNREALKVVFRP